MPPILSDNPGNGFSGQTRRCTDTGDLLPRATCEHRFDHAARALICAFQGFGIGTARIFLDSKDGRRFGETVTGHMLDGLSFDAAIDLALIDWRRTFAVRGRPGRKMPARLTAANTRLENAGVM